MKRDTFDFNCQIKMFPNKLCNYSCQVQTSPKILNYEESTNRDHPGGDGSVRRRETKYRV